MAGIYRKPVMAGVMLTGVVLTGVLTGGPSAARASASACPAGQINGSAATPTGAGYWLVDSGGDVFSFGDARFAGSVGGKSQSKPLRKPVVAIVPTRSGSGYWEVAADGAVSAFGDAVAPAGNRLPGTKLKAPVVGAARVGGHGGTPGPSAGTCAKDSGYSGPKPCQASSTVGVDCSGLARWGEDYGPLLAGVLGAD
jgi:hypothetical protein